MLSTFKAQLKIQFEDLEFNDFSDAVQEEFGIVNVTTMTLYTKKRLGVKQSTIEKIKETQQNHLAY
ncbi:hypothetical protein ACO2J1_02200 [Leptospira interrogans]|uniref:Uncharacterized protein n=22 Tax=Leptospira interrogans TaxID=173 RepID=Q8F9K7_LEPIN|nr:MULTISPECIES: hypothetical protein [Leptospira]APH40170.1 Uncharacterized protein A9P81_0201 [Leptospira interrogans serovar Copenhageni/Icterohaemorrhagiae]EMF43499.1 hypothetical protein LEP1GSC067_1337 [Leptospira interrogans serovar Lora str. TE 1992]EMF72737.1 hypothetical protein LEP1GSC148_3188 [Leptospira interrogans serovar Canicola str. LT1962]EMG09478.1 hypothetical protein LEP1GSC151_4518 [Leptospira interrogans serovar Grippotyphosa str. LT2186]EMG22774.1 hypothetical protein L